MLNAMLAAVRAATPEAAAAVSAPPRGATPALPPVASGLIVSAHPSDSFRPDAILSALLPRATAPRGAGAVTTDVVDAVLTDLLSTGGQDRTCGGAYVLADEDAFVFDDPDDFPLPAPRDAAGPAVHHRTIEFRDGTVILGGTDLDAVDLADGFPPPCGTAHVTSRPVRFVPMLTDDGRGTKFRHTTSDSRYVFADLDDYDDDFPMPPDHGRPGAEPVV